MIELLFLWGVMLCLAFLIAYNTETGSDEGIFRNMWAGVAFILLIPIFVVLAIVLWPIGALIDAYERSQGRD